MKKRGLVFIFGILFLSLVFVFSIFIIENVSSEEMDYKDYRIWVEEDCKSDFCIGKVRIEGDQRKNLEQKPIERENFVDAGEISSIPEIRISTCQELQDIKNNLSANYILTNNIDCSETRNWNKGKGFEPLGNWSSPFNGTIDGQKHIISKLYINRSERYRCTGLFGLASRNAKIKNIYLKNSLVVGNTSVGGITGYNSGTIFNSSFEGSVIGNEDIGGVVGYNSKQKIAGHWGLGYWWPLDYYPGEIKNTYFDGEVSGKENIGGVVGLNVGDIINSHSEGKVSGEESIGGLVGYNWRIDLIIENNLAGSNIGNITKSYSESRVHGEYDVGGLVGFNINKSIIKSSYSIGNVTSFGKWEKVGGLVGWNGPGGKVHNSYSTGNVTGSDFLYSRVGLIGYNQDGIVKNSFWDINTSGETNSDGGTGKTTKEMKDVRTFTDIGWSEGLEKAWDFVGNPYDDFLNKDIWDTSPEINQGYPYLIMNRPSSFKRPILQNLPDKKINQDSKPESRWIDLRNYVSDEDTPKKDLDFSIESQSNSNLIDCRIDADRYIKCERPKKGQSGYSDISVRVIDEDRLSDTDSFRIEVIPPSLSIMVIPFDWSGDYNDYLDFANSTVSYFLERIPLANCPEQFNFIKVEKTKDYGENWDNWKCKPTMEVPLNKHCFWKGNSVLERIQECAEEYKDFENSDYDYVVGLSDNNITYFSNWKCDYGTNGWTDVENNLFSVVSEIRDPGTVAHELGHKFGLSDQYCNCDGTESEKFCGTKVKYSKLRKELGCDPHPIWGDCCLSIGKEIYPGCYDLCYGNLDRFGIDLDNNGTLDAGNRTAMSFAGGPERNHFDKYEYKHLQDIPKLQCESGLESGEYSVKSNEETGFNIQLMLGIDKKDNIRLKKLNFTNHESFIGEGKGEYSLRILDTSNNTLYEDNFSVDFVLLSDPPSFTNESVIFRIIQYQKGMEKLKIYHNEELLFSHPIPSFCNNNGECNRNENYMTCSDCDSSSKDEICNRQEGDGCDLDCGEGVDPDCADLIVSNVSLIGDITEGKETNLEINLSNLGVRNISVKIGLYSDSILEANKSINISGNSSSIISLNWTPAQECSRDLILSLDIENRISEMNKTNNEFKINNVSIFMIGDINLDREIDIFDLAAVGLAYGSNYSSKNWNPDADLNNDGNIDIFDLATVGLNYGREC